LDIHIRYDEIKRLDGTEYDEDELPAAIRIIRTSNARESMNSPFLLFDSIGPFRFGGTIALGTSAPAARQLSPIAADYLARGIAAEENGQFGIALYWYLNADYYDAIEAKKKAALLEFKLKSGNPWGITGNSIQI
jgi:hypothetical protein